MASDPREALIALFASEIETADQEREGPTINTFRVQVGASACVNILCAWALEPAQVERAAKVEYERFIRKNLLKGGSAEVEPWAALCRDAPDIAESARATMRAALTALFGGDDGN